MNCSPVSTPWTSACCGATSCCCPPRRSCRSRRRSSATPSSTGLARTSEQACSCTAPCPRPWRRAGSLSSSTCATDPHSWVLARHRTSSPPVALPRRDRRLRPGRCQRRLAATHRPRHRGRPADLLCPDQQRMDRTANRSRPGPAGQSRVGPAPRGAPVIDLNGSLITRQHVLSLLPLLRLSPAQEERLLAMRYPVDSRAVEAAFESLGVDMDTLIDRMGGSP